MKTVNSVAVILEREHNSMIEEWLSRVNLSPDLTAVPLSDAERTDHLPKLFDELISRLRLGRDAQPRISIVAGAHGEVRFAQGYSASMLVDESQIFQVSTFSKLHLH